MATSAIRKRSSIKKSPGRHARRGIFHDLLQGQPLSKISDKQVSRNRANLDSFTQGCLIGLFAEFVACADAEDVRTLLTGLNEWGGGGEFRDALKIHLKNYKVRFGVVHG